MSQEIDHGKIGLKVRGDLARRMRAMKKQTGQPASRLAITALEYFIPAIERGEFAIINGKLVAITKELATVGGTR
jgi:hypothetical protein